MFSKIVERLKLEQEQKKYYKEKSESIKDSIENRLFFKQGKMSVSTLKSCDRDEYVYETAIIKESFHTKMITVVQTYDTYEEAKEGHEYWEKMILSGQLKPFEKLKNVIDVSPVDFSTSRIKNYEKAVKFNRKSR